MNPPVSVCQYVSTMGRHPPATCSRSQRHAASFSGSPTLATTRTLLRSKSATSCSAPAAISARIAVGAVYRWVAPACSAVRHSSARSGCTGDAPSSTLVAPITSGAYTP